MAFVVETGDGLEDSNSYITVDWADTYFADRGNDDWVAAIDVAKQVALIRATDYLDTVYKFVGIKSSSAQALEWPRSYAEDKYGEALDGIPLILRKATAELAVRALDDELMEDFDFSGRVKRERVEGAVEIEYADEGIIQQKSFPYVDKLLLGNGLTTGKYSSTGQLKIIRV